MSIQNQMTITAWVRRNLRHYRLRHAVFAATCALTAAIFCAALLTGESLQASLRAGLRARLGAIRSVALLADGVFPADMAQRLPGSEAALLLRGELLTAEGLVCAPDAQVIGRQGPPAAEGRAALNGRALAQVPGAAGAVRFVKPSPYAAELPLGPINASRLVRRNLDFSAASEAPVASGALLPADFALRPASVPPVNVFVPLAALARDAGVPGMANLLLSSLQPTALARALSEALTPEACGLELRDQRAEGGGQEKPGTVITSRRVFLPAGVHDALTRAGLPVAAATFHLADGFEAGDRSTPYGFVAAVTPGGPQVPSDLRDDEVVINAWLAEALGVSSNGTVTLRWRRFEAGGRLSETQGVFRVRGVLPMEVAAAARRAMPVFPGLEGVDRCADWDIGLPMDEERLNDAANEAYWKAWRATPKAFLTHAAGTACFGTVFGESMSLRVAADEATVRTALKGVAPERFGFQVRPVWKEGLAAARGSTDFRLLFSGMAFMLAAAALLLAALSLALALEARKGEIALLRALGWSRGRVTRVLLAEGCVPLGVGALAGSCGGAFLARALVWSLGRFWRDAFAGAEPAFIFSFPVAVLAAGVSVGASLLVVLRSAARYAACPPTELWQAQGVSEPAVFTAGGGAPVSRATAVLSPCGGVLALAALAVMVWSPGGSAAHGAFFGAGFLLMLSLMLFMASLGVAWRRAALGRAASVRSPLAAGVSRALSMPRRSAPVVILLAVGLFLTVGILAMRHDPAAGCEHPWSGSGGFRAIVTAAVARDRARGLELAREASGATGVVPVRVREGDEAGCLNLNAPQTPRLLGLDTRAMARARAFEPREAGGVWSPLARLLPDGAIPVLAADQAMVQYSLKVKAGLTDGAVLTYAGADGTPWRVRIVGALPVRSGILQGALIMDERFFARMYPEEGYRMWLCDYAPYALREAADAARGRQEDGRRAQLAALRHPAPGVTVETVEERLRTLGAMEASYLDLFVVLGGLGLVLGAAGMALVILRGVEERRGEFALLGAVGVPWRQRVRLLAGEYGVLAAAGVVCGMLPALVAIQPAARALGAQLPWLAMGAVAAGLAGCLAVCVWGAARAAAGRFDPAALREL